MQSSIDYLIVELDGYNIEMKKRIQKKREIREECNYTMKNKKDYKNKPMTRLNRNYSLITKEFCYITWLDTCL